MAVRATVTSLVAGTVGVGAGLIALWLALHFAQPAMLRSLPGAFLGGLEREGWQWTQGLMD